MGGGLLGCDDGIVTMGTGLGPGIRWVTMVYGLRWIDTTRVMADGRPLHCALAIGGSALTVNHRQ